MNRFVRNLNRIAATLAFSVLAVPAVLSQTDISDIPMAVKNNVPPNFVFMVDSSGSMRNVVPEAPFKSDVSYTGCANGGVKLANTSSVFIRITANGVPYFAAGSTDYDWGVEYSKKDIGETGKSRRCFDPAKTYEASLNGDSGAVGELKKPSGTSVGKYSGNYLNWYFGVGADGNSGNTAVNFGVDARLKPGQRSRMEIARLVTNSTLDGLPSVSDGEASVRVGLVSYNGSNGGKLLKGVADLTSSSLELLKGSVSALEAGGSTPLSETLADIGHYFTLGYTGDLTLYPDVEDKSTTASVSSFFTQGTTTPHKLSGVANSTAPPVEYWCQRSYAILMTDGLPEEDQALSSNSYLCDYDGDTGSCKTNGSGAYDKKDKTHTGHLGGVHSYVSSGSDYLDDVAQALFDIDLRPDLLAPEGRPKKNNVRTYTVGFADDAIINDPLMLETAKQGGGLFLTASDTTSLQKAFKKAMDDAFAKDGASSAVAVVNTNITVDNTSYASDYSSGTWVGDLKAYSLNTTTGLPIIPEVWSAGQKLDERDIVANPRTIVTYDGNAGGVEFNEPNTDLGKSVVDFVLGDKSEEGKTLRIRSSRLGDIVNAEPVVVKYGEKTAVFQGANDGLLHVFDGSLGAGGGRELWAYAPRQLHSNLASYSSPDYAHLYFVDATPIVGTVTVDGETRKILVGGYGKGGRGYFALDITSYEEPGTAGFAETIAKKVLWERLGEDSDVGFSFGRPQIVKTAMSPGWLVLVAGGHNNESGDGVVIGLHPLTGQELLRIKTGAGNASTPSGLSYLARPSQLEDTEAVRYVYGGDLLGNVWRFDLEANDFKGTAVKIAVLKDPSGTVQPVTTAPSVGPVVGSSDKNFVYLGTGLYLGDSDVPGTPNENGNATQVQSVYGIIDDVTLAAPGLPNIRGSNGGSCPEDGGNGDFVCQDTGDVDAGAYTFSSNLIGEDQTGWYFDLPVTNARVITHPQLTSTGTLALTVNIPTNVKCDPGGSSWFVTVLASSGGAIPTTYGGDKYWSSMSFLGYALASRPVIITTAEGKRGVIRLSDRSFRSPVVPDPPPAPGPTPPGWRKLYWRDLGLVN